MAPLDLAVHRWGGGGRRALLVHGLTWNAAGWWRVGADLAARGWEVVAPDLRGHGESPQGADYRLASYAEDLLALGRGWDAVLGHSLGGAVAVVAETLDSGFARRMILQDPALLMAALPPEEAIARLVEPYLRPPTVEAVLADNPSWHPEDARLKLEALALCRPAVVEATVRDNPDWNLVAETAALPVPTLVVGGDPGHGGILPVTLGEWFSAESPLVDYTMLAGSGHSAHREPAVYDGYLEVTVTAMEGAA